VHFKQVKGWREIRNAMKQLKIGHNNQYKWRFDTLDAALNFLSLIRTQVEINTNSSLCQNWDEPPHFSHPMCGEVEFGGGLDTERFTQN
jgi:hypothetical protein